MRFRGELPEEKFVIPGLRGVVEDRAVGREEDVFERLTGKGRVEDQLVELGDIARIVLVVVVVHRLLGNRRRKRVISIGQLLRDEARFGCGIGRCHNQRYYE